MLDSNIGLEPEEQIYSGGFNKTPKDEKLIFLLPNKLSLIFGKNKKEHWTRTLVT